MQGYDELYQQVIEELNRKPEPGHKALFEFVKKQCYPLILSWCNGVYYLKGGDHENDVLQETQIRVFRNVYKGFFCREGYFDESKPLHDFMAWIKTIARSAFNTYLKKHNRMKNVDPLADAYGAGDEAEGHDNSAVVGVECRGLKNVEKADEIQFYLNQSFCLVLNLKTSLHIMFSWLIGFLLSVIGAYERMESTRIVAVYFEEKTMSEMFEYIVKYASQIPWLKFSEESIQSIRMRLSEKTDDNKTVGETTFGSYYQKKGGRASISDWINRVDAKVCQNISIADFDEN